MNSNNRKANFWSVICIIGIAISVIMFFLLYSTLPNLRSGYKFKTDYLMGHFAFSWVPFIFFSLVLFLIKKNSQSKNQLTSNNSEYKPIEKNVSRKKIEKPNDNQDKLAKNFKVNTDEDIKRMNSKSEEDIYDLIGKEIEEKNLKRGIWTKAIAESNGDKEKAEAIYIKLRFAQLSSK